MSVIILSEFCTLWFFFQAFNAQCMPLDSILPEKVNFWSSQIEISGSLYWPVPSDPAKKLPVVIMGPGFSGVKECNYQFIAEQFAKGGFAVLLFDYPNFGASGGTNRQEADPWQQVEAYRDAIGFVAAQERIDKDKIGVWGGSYSGGHTLVVAALDTRVKCFVALAPYLGGYDFISKIPLAQRQGLAQLFNQDRLNRSKGGKPMMIPVVSEKPGELCVLATKSAYLFKESFKAYALDWKNVVTLKSLEMQLDYQPVTYVNRIGNIPKLFLIAKKDELIAEKQLLEVYEHASEPKTLDYVEGNHFSPYMESRNEMVDKCLVFFKKHLL